MEYQTDVIEEGPAPLVPKDVKIDVIATGDAKNAGDFSLDIKTVGHGKGNKITLPKNDNFKLIFTLHDNTNPKLGLRFDASAPIFVKEGGLPCPTDISTQQVMVDSCDAKTLVVIDWNSGPELELYYKLNFVNENGTAKYNYDPPITNGGGGNSPLAERQNH